MKRKQLKKLFPWSIRNWVQIGVLSVTIIIGLQFALFVHQIAGDGEITIPRPAGVEGFLPIGALTGWKHFIQTGLWDGVHPAGMVILGFAIFISWTLRKSFCGWFCPIGTISEWLWRVGQWGMGKNSQLPKFVDIPLRSIKYILMFLFIGAVLGMSESAVAGFLSGDYWKIADIKMLRFFTNMSSFTAMTLLVLIFLSLFIRNFWCRYLCPYGALTGLVAVFSPTWITRSEDPCTNCGKCAKVCPAYLPVDKKTIIFSAECTGCLNCVEICPARNTMTLKTAGLKAGFWTGKRLAIAILGLYIFLVLIAGFSSHWTSDLTPSDFRTLYPRIEFLSH